MRIGFNRATVGGSMVLLVVCAAIVGAFYTPFDPAQISFTERLQPPSAAHWLGTDHYGRDMLSRILSGAGVSFVTALASVMTAMAAGITLGAIAGYAGGVVDKAITVLIDALLAFPGLLLALALMAVVGASMVGVVIAIGVAFTPSVARVTRGSVLSTKQKEFVSASKLLGKRPGYTLFVHIVPNAVSPLIALGTSLIAAAILVESALSFLGVGVPPPAASWGGLLADGRQFLGQANWLSVYPGLAITLAVLGVNLVGDALRDRFDPRMNPHGR